MSPQPDDRPLRPGDQVEVRLRGVVDSDGFIRVDGDGTGNWAFPPGRVAELEAEVTVTLAVDAPEWDEWGTVRSDGHYVWVKTALSVNGRAGDGGTWWELTEGEERTHDQVAEFPIVGAVPGTEAWEALLNRVPDRDVDAVARGLSAARDAYPTPLELSQRRPRRLAREDDE